MTQTLTPPQAEVVEAGLLESGFNCLLQMPTGSGKTWLAERAIAATLEAGQRAIYLTPLRALADELMAHWQQRFAPHPVGVFTGDYGASGRAYPVPFAQAHLLVMTPERLDACTRAWRSHWHWLPHVDLVVVDEFHLLGEPRRGARLEGALLRLRRLNPFARIVSLSATMGNRGELAQWLDAVEYSSTWRPVPLTWRMVRYRRALDKPHLLAGEVQRAVAAGGKSLVFVQSRRRAEELATYLQGQGLRARHHHAGLNHAQRRAVEESFRGAAVDVLVATATLEMGINLPARQVVLYDLQQFDGVGFSGLSTNTVWQRAGRAGRRGLDDEGEVVLLAPTWDRSAAHYLDGRFEPIYSQLADPAALAEQIVAEVASGLARTPAQLESALAHSLAARQARLPMVAGILQAMEQAGLLAWKTDEAEDAGRTLVATPLARVAVRHFLAPATVLALRHMLATTQTPTLFDLLLMACSVSDCEPLLAVDFEELDALASDVGQEATWLLHRPAPGVAADLGIGGRRLLASLKMALVLRTWTRTGDAAAAAERYDCYPFEVQRLCESALRVLIALRAVADLLAPAPDADEPAPAPDEVASTSERIAALTQMVGAGLDEHAATLTFVPGIGPQMARRLLAAGIEDIEMLAQAEPAALGAVKGLSATRAAVWVAAAEEIVPVRSALRYREVGARAPVAGIAWPESVDPYRLRRALDLEVKRTEMGRYLVTGGLEPHWVVQDGAGLHCDCADARRGHRCKHSLATGLAAGDPLLQQCVQRLGAHSTEAFDLFALWTERTQ